MTMLNPIKKISKREIDIMDVLWTQSKPLVASEIIKYNPDLSISTVQTALKKLVNKDFIEMADIVYSGTVLARSYRPIISQKDYEKYALANSLSTFRENNITLSKFASAFFDLEKDKDKALKELNELEKIIREQKNKLNT